MSGAVKRGHCCIVQYRSIVPSELMVDSLSETGFLQDSFELVVVVLKAQQAIDIVEIVVVVKSVLVMVRLFMCAKV